MCEPFTPNVSIDKQKAFKVFSINNNGELQTCFKNSYNSSLVYKPHTRIDVVPDTSVFFEFKEFKDAVRITDEGIRKWNFISDDLIVLPVILYDVIYEGSFVIRSDDIQYLDRNAPVFYSRSIFVIDGKDYREKFYRSIVKGLFRWCGRSRLQTKAIMETIPWINSK